MSLHNRLTTMSAAVVATVLALGSVTCYVVMRHQLRAQVDRQLTAQVQIIAGFAQGPGGAAEGQPPAALLAAPVGTTRDDAVYGQLVRASGSVFRPPTLQAGLPVQARDLAVARAGRGRVLSDRRVQGRHLRVVTTALGRGSAMVIGRPLAQVDSALRSLRLVLLAIVVTGTALAAAAGRLLSRRVLAPIDELTRMTQHVRETGDLARRIGMDRTDEVGVLAQRFDAMLERLEASQGALAASTAAQRQLVADASHELRTPVAGLRTNVEVLLDGRPMAESKRRALMADVVVQTEELSAVVTDLIELARGDLPVSDGEDLDLADLVRAGLSRIRRYHPEQRYDEAVESWPMSGSRERLARAVNNVLDNAAKFSPPRSTILVTFRHGVLRVADAGCGVQPQDLPHLFDRFFRGAGAGAWQGSGLGLAIVKQVVESHGGSVAAAPGATGGLEVTLRFVGDDHDGGPGLAEPAVVVLSA